MLLGPDTCHVVENPMRSPRDIRQRNIRQALLRLFVSLGVNGVTTNDESLFGSLYRKYCIQDSKLMKKTNDMSESCYNPTS